jgi:hypothetical protein
VQYQKWCPDCNRVLPLEAFSKSKSSKDGRQGKCKGCYRVYQMAHRYGLSTQRYHALVEHHQGQCGICEKELPLVIDHCHKTGKVRGLLCQNCNKALGLLEDDLDIVRAAEAYLIHG